MYHWMLAALHYQFLNILKNYFVGDQDGDSWQFGVLVLDWKAGVFRPGLKRDGLKLMSADPKLTSMSFRTTLVPHVLEMVSQGFLLHKYWCV